MPATDPDGTASLSRVRRWENRTAWPLFAGSVVFFAYFTFAWVDPHPSITVYGLSAVVVALLWIWFIVDYLIRLVLARGARKRFFVTHVFDLITIVLPVFRPFLILVTIWRLPVFTRGGETRLRIRYGLITVLFSFIYVYVNSYLVWAVEKGDPHANIRDFGDAVWWGFSTITTVGYGDYVPVTDLGRVFAIGLMLGGVLVLGVITATVLSYITDKIRTLALTEKNETDHKEHSA